MSDPFEALASPTVPVDPDPAFARRLRARLSTALGLDTTVLVPSTTPTGRSPMSDIDQPSPVAALAAGAVGPLVPYLTVADGAAAIAFYVAAFGAVEEFRVVGDDGRLGHAELTIGTARVMLSDEFPEIGVVAPTTLGGTGVALHLQVADVDRVYALALAAGAAGLTEPADQPHGARHGTLLDPSGHRWMLSQPLEAFDLDTYRERSEGSGFTVVPGSDAGDDSAAVPGRGAIWASLNYADALAGIAFVVDVLGFEADLVVPAPDDPDVVIHSQLRWPEGGIVQAGSADRSDSEFSMRPTGAEALYVVTADPDAVWRRCLEAGAEVVAAPSTPDYDPTGMVFSVRDPEGNIWSFGTYAGDAPD